MNKNIYRKKHYYKGMEIGAFGLPILIEKKKDNSKRKNRKRDYYNNTFCSPFKSLSPKNLIVMYDIPSEHKKERDWLRRHLVKFNYIMIQKSVWVGPSPLPKDFLDYLKEIKIENNLKTFKLANPYKNSKNSTLV
jgi:CRISPR-associated endonuclease Cas2